MGVTQLNTDLATLCAVRNPRLNVAYIRQAALPSNAQPLPPPLLCSTCSRG